MVEHWAIVQKGFGFNYSARHLPAIKEWMGSYDKPLINGMTPYLLLWLTTNFYLIYGILLWLDFLSSRPLSGYQFTFPISNSHCCYFFIFCLLLLVLLASNSFGGWLRWWWWCLFVPSQFQFQPQTPLMIREADEGAETPALHIRRVKLDLCLYLELNIFHVFIWNLRFFPFFLIIFYKKRSGMYLSYKAVLGRSTVRWAHCTLLYSMSWSETSASHLVTYETMSFGRVESEILNSNSGNMLDTI